MLHAVDAEGAVFSQLDSERFGVRAARAQVTAETLSRALDFCAAEKIDLLITRCTTNDLVAVQNMEAHGFLLMDTLVYYGFDLSRKSIPQDTRGFFVRQLQAEDKDQVRMVAVQAFRGYRGHYHADPRLDKRKCDETYASWAERSAILKTAADEVLIVEQGGNLVGFATLRLNSPQEGEGLLVAVAPEYQKRGACQALMVHSLQWCRSQGAGRMVISTQITNVAMQKVWCRVGFEPRCSYYTFHKWFD
jgi:ribosomal protein S18 acetylase RimI-like enzyme